MDSVVSGRTAFIVFSVVVHGAFAAGIGELEVKKTHAATSIRIAEAKRPAAKKPEPAKLDPPPRKPEPRSKERHAAVAKVAEAPPEAAPPPDAPAPLSDLPDFGLSLSGGVGGTGLAMAAGGRTKAASRGPTAPTNRAPKKLAMSADPAALDPCQDPPAKPKPRSIPQPAYTDAARSAVVEGRVRVQLTVDETGRVVSVKLLQGLGHGLDEAALAAARQAEFEPAVRCGKPTSATFNISMRFNLS